MLEFVSGILTTFLLYADSFFSKGFGWIPTYASVKFNWCERFSLYGILSPIGQSSCSAIFWFEAIYAFCKSLNVIKIKKQ